MAKRKQKPSEMPPDIDLEEWELEVQRKRERIEADEELLGLAEWLMLADTAADCIRQQFYHVFNGEETATLEAFLGELSGIGNMLNDPNYDVIDCNDVDEYAEEMSKYTSKRLPEPLKDLFNRLYFFAAKWTEEMKHKNNDIYGH